MVTSAYTVSGSDGVCLHFPSNTYNLYQQYQREERLLKVRTYALLRARFGVYASNQGGYVPQRSDLNRLDSVIMEALYQGYLVGKDNG